MTHVLNPTQYHINIYRLCSNKTQDLINVRNLHSRIFIMYLNVPENRAKVKIIIIF